ncbi:LuxR family transcriptional regulator [Nocardioides sp.]|uniref:helix-turn-helix transcriptional regulator n=1 Tax=Nocardioides sp. TaxID=35761 RepID=UPI0026058A0A|nr:LuxR family transcriptional regulator [Nocardioides sp.]
MTTAASGPHLLGRSEERAVLAAFLDGRDAHSPTIATLEGPAGIGKTALWRSALHHAEHGGWRVLSAAAFEGETGLGAVTLADLLGSVADAETARLSAAYRDVLDALRHGEDAGNDAALAAAFTALLGSLAEQAPTLVAVDDVQWLDDRSAETLTFAVRRHGTPRIAFLHTRRTDRPQPAESALRDRALSLWLPPLGADTARRLVAERVTGLGRTQVAEVVAAAAGNPLHALELGRAVVRNGWAGVAATVTGLMGATVEALPAPARTAVLAVALSPAVRSGELAAAVGLDAVEEAFAAGVLERAGDEVRFVHPLVGSVAVELSGAAERRRLHAALADAIADDARHWLHAGRAAQGPDEALAAALARASGRAEVHGRRRPAIELAEHALRLTPSHAAERDERLVALAERLQQAGEMARARELLGDVAGLGGARLRARAYLLLVDVDPAPLPQLQEHLDRAAIEAGEDPCLRAHVLVESAAFAVRGHVERIGDAAEWAQEAVRLAGEDTGLLRRALFEWAWARAAAGEPVAALLERERSLPGPAAVAAYGVERVALITRMWRGDLAASRAAFTTMLRTADEQGERESAGAALVQLAEVEVRAGRWEAAATAADQLAEASLVQDVDPAMRRLRAQIAAGRGQVALAHELAAEAIASAQAVGMRWQELEARRAMGVILLLEAGGVGSGAGAGSGVVSRVGAGLPGDRDRAAAGAVVALSSVWTHLREGGFGEPGAFPVAAELAAALAATGAVAGLQEVVGALAEVGDDHPWAAAARHAAEGHLALLTGPGGSGVDAAIGAFGEAADGFGALGFAFDQARCLSHAGSAARRARRLREAKALLGEAAERFDALGSSGWSAGVRAEAAQLGGRPRTAEGTLTATERRVAELVAQGLRNRDVAKRLVVSESAVEATLSRLYARLGIRSRTELAARLPELAE